MINKNFFAMLAFIAGMLLLVSAIYSLSSGISTEGLIYFGIAAASLITSFFLRTKEKP
jgi:ABC-type transport system involved in cytochrome c biogenesis permease subunit